jgi:hypothetical protein
MQNSEPDGTSPNLIRIKLSGAQFRYVVWH